MPKQKNRALLLLTAALLAAAVCGALFFFIRQQNAVDTRVTIVHGPHNVYDRTLVVTADRDYDPYTFLDENGEPCGHNIELLYLLADKMGYNTELRLLPWREAVAAVETGEADMVLTASWSQSKSPGLAFSVPLVNDPFVAFGKSSYTQIGELYDKRLSAMEGTGCVAGFLRPYRLETNTTFYSSTRAAFRAVETGECDYAVTRYSVGRRFMANTRSSGIRAVGPTLLDNYICIGVDETNRPLLAALDEAIVTLSADGTLAELSDKWLGQYVQTLTLGELLVQNLDRLTLALGLLLLSFLTGLIWITRTAARRREATLRRLAERDQLTGLYNRAACEELIRKTLESSSTASDIHALLVIDMDNFKQINDVLGHMEGDAALVRMASLLSDLFRSGDVVGRLGGDEFFIFLPHCRDAEAALQKAMQVCAAGNGRAKGETAFPLSASVGVAMYPAQGESFAALYKRADEALYEAKRCGKKHCAFYDGSGAPVCRSC